jgi:hypothetical protein
MNAGNRVVDALELARHRLHEPNVRGAYNQLITLIDQQLQERLLDNSETGILTEPQLVFIEYGLRHVQGAPAVTLVRSADKLIAALSQQDSSATPPVVPLADMRARYAEEHPVDGDVTDSAQNAESAPQSPNHETQSPSHPASPTPLIKRLVQKVGRVTGGSVTINGVQQNTIYRVSPSAAEAGATGNDGDEADTGELQPVTSEPEVTVSDVFISYCHRDGSRMRRLREDLRSHGLRVWTDENLQPGTPSWKRAVESAVRGGRALVVIMTPDAKRSSWVESEINTAMAHDVPIFPVLCKGDTKNAVPFALNGYQFVDMRKEGQYREAMLRLIKAIKSKVRSR